MPIRLPILDDRTYADLNLELRTLIPVYAPDWTDHNPSDPGITLLELFAWLAEGLMYRVDRVPEASTVRMLELLGATFRPAQPATVVLRASVPRGGVPEGGLTVRAGALLTARPTGQDAVLPFETVDKVRLTPEWLEGLMTARQVGRIGGEYLGRSNGRPHQSFPLAQARANGVGVVLDSKGPRTNDVGIGDGLRQGVVCIPEVTVDGQRWEYREDLVHSGPDDHHFTVDARRSVIRFGPGREGAGRRVAPKSDVQREGGAVPPVRAVLQASYCYTLGAGGNMAGAVYALADTQARIVLEAVEPAAGGSDPTSLEDARAEVYRLINDAWRAITNDDFEQLVLEQKALHLARAKSLPEVEIARVQRKGESPAASASTPALASAEGEPELRPEAGHVSLIVYPRPMQEPAAAIEPDAIGPDAIGAEDISGEAGEESVSPVRDVIFSADGQVAALRIGPFAGRLDRVWIWQANGRQAGTNPTAQQDDVLPDTYRGAAPLPLPDNAAVTSLALSPDGRWAALGTVRAGRPEVILWDVERLARVDLPANLSPASAQPANPQPVGPVSGFVFRPDGRQVLIVAGATLERRNVPSWEPAGEMPHPAPVQTVLYGPAPANPVRQLIATVAGDNAVRLWGRLRGAAPVELLAVLPHAEPVSRLLFSPDGRWLVTLSGAKTVLAWELAPGVAAFAAPATPGDNGEPATINPGADPVRMADVATEGLSAIEKLTGIAFRQRGRRLAIVGDPVAGDAGRTAAFLDVETGAVESSWRLPVGSSANVLSPELHRLLLVDESDALHPQLWDVDMNRRVGVLHHDAPVFAALFSPEGDHVVTLAGAPAAGPSADGATPVGGMPGVGAPAAGAPGSLVARAWNTEGAALETMAVLAQVPEKSASGQPGTAGGQPTAPVAQTLLLRSHLLRESRQRRARSRAAASIGMQPVEGVLGPEGRFLVTWQWVPPAPPAHDGRALSVRIWAAEHLARAWELLNERRLVTTQHHVVGTRFVDVQVRAAVVPAPRADSETLIAAIRDSLRDFFAPLRDGGGWPWGRHVHLSEVYQVIEGVAGVDHVETLSLYTRDEEPAGASTLQRQDAGVGAPATALGAATPAPWYDSGPEVVVPANQLVHYVRLPMAGETAAEPGAVRDIIVRRTG